MRKVINIILYTLCLVFIVYPFIKNPYIKDLYKKVNIASNKSFDKNFNNHRFVCIDLKDSKMTRFKEEKTDSIVYVSNYSGKYFVSILTKGTSLSDKVCGTIKDNDNLLNELSTSIEEEQDIKLSKKYFTNLELKKEKLPYQILAIIMIVLGISFILGIIANIIAIIRKEF